MSRNICGNCANFKPEKGKRFFNCTFAKHADTSYGMQVRADTASCDAFKPIQIERAPVPSKPVKARARPRGLCPWGRLIAIVAIILILALLSWAVYNCASKGTKVSPTPTPTTTPTLTGSPTPTPAPAYRIIGNYTVGQWALIPGELATITSASQVSCVPVAIGCKQAPPGLVYIEVSVTASNPGDSPVPLDVTHFFLGDATGLHWQVSEYDRVIDPGYSIPPGDSKHGELWFLIPNTPFSELKVYWALMGDPLKWTVWKLPF